MSTIKLENIQHPEASTPAIMLNNDGTMDLSINNYPGRNRVINGDFRIWQRGTASQYNAGQGAYHADRWCGSLQYQNSRTSRVAAVSKPAEMSATWAMRCASSSASEVSNGTRIRVGQKIEALDCYSLRGKEITLSFWVRFSSSTISSVTNSTNSNYGNWNYTIGFNTTTTDSATNTNGWDSNVSLSIANGSLPTSWTKYTLTTTVPANANNITPFFNFSSLGSTTNNEDSWYEITEVQLEQGSVATPFEHRSYADELVRCQRFYEKSAVNGSFVFGNPVGTHAATSTIRYAVSKRTNPTLSIGGPNLVTRWYGGSTTYPVVAAWIYSDGFIVDTTDLANLSGVTAFATWTADAEI